MRITYAITVSGEYNEIKKLVPFLLENKRKEDDIIILYDEKNGDKRVLNFLLEYNNTDDLKTFKSKSFNNHFADWKNRLNSYCTGNYIFQLDADEMLHEDLLKNIDKIIELNSEVDLFFFPRINIVDGITENHIKEWKWRIDEKNRINFPDYQGRLYKKGLSWNGSVHERIIGAKYYSILPDQDEYCIIHHKDIRRQEKQNKYYSTI